MSTKTAKDVMTTAVLTVAEDMPVTELASFLSQSEITGAPVEDDSGKVSGVVSVVDIARAESGRNETASVWDGVVTHSYHHDWGESLDDGLRIFHLKESEATVGDIMNRTIQSVDGDTPVREIAEKMRRYHLHRLLVMNRPQRL